ncbi:MAG: glycoside hydrolase family 18 protein [Cyclobacteriaceae bacterium]|nr:glycoside hydrolase family 18 protein [Cyclobacteriaceae bacterium]
MKSECKLDCLIVYMYLKAKSTQLLLIFGLLITACQAQSTNKFTVIAYYFGGPETVDSIAVEKLTHVIFSFCHLKGNTLQVDDSRDATTLSNLVALKKRNPALKVLLSLGGWGGCASCSDVFSTVEGREAFAQSVLALNKFFKSDGIDLDWEYPTIQGYPGHKYMAADKQNFTELVRTLRTTLGNDYEISFAAGGFQKFLDESVSWKDVMPVVDRVNLMTYDLVNGNSTMTGHHTALYSSPGQQESTDNAVKHLIKIGIPANKLVIGAAFYGRMWENVPAEHNGLYQPGKFKMGISYKKIKTEISKERGFVPYWDDVAKAPYQYNAAEKLFLTYDNRRSMELKTKYVADNHLNGIMFWEITNDAYTDGLLDAIHDVKKKYKSK